jgi:hypothetical protein
MFECSQVCSTENDIPYESESLSVIPTTFASWSGESCACQSVGNDLQCIFFNSSRLRHVVRGSFELFLSSKHLTGLASHRYSTACKRSSTLISHPSPPCTLASGTDTMAQNDLPHSPSTICASRLSSDIPEAFASVLYEVCTPSQSFTLSCTTRIAFCAPIAIPPAFFCLFLSFYTPLYSYLLGGALGRVPCTRPYPKMQLQQLSCGTVCASTQRRRRPLTPCSRCPTSSPL